MSRVAILLVVLGLACTHKTDDAPVAAPEAPLAAGNRAPDFTARAHDGSEVKLSALRGKPVVLYFYPKDDTPGCTAEAEAFRDGSDAFAEAGAEIIGVSFDDEHSHRAFAAKHDLGFRLIADTDGALARKFGVPTRMGLAKRTTFVIDRDGKIAHTFADVQVDGHDHEVLAAVKSAR
jgi:peroxiredoxin Q/BCP